MQDSELQTKLAKAFKIDEMSESERDALLAQAGSIIIDSAVGRLLLSLSEAEVAQLELYFDTHEKIEDIVSHLFNTYPLFDDIIQEEVIALQYETEKVVSATIK